MTQWQRQYCVKMTSRRRFDVIMTCKLRRTPSGRRHVKRSLVQSKLVQFMHTLEDFSDAHADVIKWKHFPRYWPFVRGIHRSPVNSPHKGQWRGVLIFYFDLSLNKRFSKQKWGWLFKTPSRPLWRHCDAIKSPDNQPPKLKRRPQDRWIALYGA